MLSDGVAVLLLASAARQRARTLFLHGVGEVAEQFVLAGKERERAREYTDVNTQRVVAAND